MASFDKEQRAKAKALKWPLVAIDAGGLEFSGPVPPRMQEKLLRFLLDFMEERRKAIEADPQAEE